MQFSENTLYLHCNYIEYIHGYHGDHGVQAAFMLIHGAATCARHCCVAHLAAGEDASPDAGWAHDLTRGAVAAALHEVRRKAEP